MRRGARLQRPRGLPALRAALRALLPAQHLRQEMPRGLHALHQKFCVWAQRLGKFFIKFCHKRISIVPISVDLDGAM
jgi:hypothetical protein